MGRVAKLIYTGLISLDGYHADSQGNFDWAAPDQEVHAFVNDLERGIGTYLLGRRMYEVMSVWETLGTADHEPVIQDYARIWKAADKVVYSSTLRGASTARTRIEPAFNPDAVRDLKEAAVGELGIGGPTLAAHALRAGLVDECRIFVNPIAVGGGTRFFPDNLGLRFGLLEERTFGSGVVYLRYGCRT